LSNRAYDDVTYAHDDVTHDHFAEQLAKQLGLPEVKAVKLVKAIKDTSVPQSSDAATDALIKELMAAAGELGLVVEQSDGKTKYEIEKLILGLPKIAASGIGTYVNYAGGLEQLQKMAGGGLDAIIAEISSKGSNIDKMLMK
jgi:hypothetical protein